MRVIKRLPIPLHLFVTWINSLKTNQNAPPFTKAIHVVHSTRIIRQSFECPENLENHSVAGGSRVKHPGVAFLSEERLITRGETNGSRYDYGGKGRERNRRRLPVNRMDDERRNQRYFFFFLFSPLLLLVLTEAAGTRRDRSRRGGATQGMARRGSERGEII